uniref:Ig-like domain-containing protein n=1 Tax=Otus sunia TaxID=257818 RepID=A0A8C8E6C8_9STRI
LKLNLLMAHEGALPAVAVDQKEKQKPEIVLVPEPARVLEGETARFRCRVTGYPLPKVNWYLNGQLIRKSKRFRLRYDGIYYLDIVDYAAVYTCEAKNDYGVATTSASLSSIIVLNEHNEVPGDIQCHDFS